jgi:hypothetical protein
MSRIRDIANILTASTNIATDAEVTAAMSAHNTATNGHVGRGTTENRPASPSVGDVYFDTTLAALITYKSTGWERVSQDPAPQIASISPTTAATTGTTITISGASFKSGLSVQFIGTNSSVYNSPVAAFVNATTATATTPVLSVAYEPYDVKVINNDNQFAILNDCLDAGGSPVWNTSSGTIVTINEQTSLNTSVSATDPDGTSIVYSSSNLPAWISLNSSTGALTGTSPDISSNTTYSFDITASDGVNSSSRSFNIISNALVPVSTNVVLYLDSGNSSSYPGSGTTWTDLSGNGKNITLVNCTYSGSGSSGYINFNGSSSYGTLGSALFGAPSSTTFSVSLWVYGNSNPVSPQEWFSQWDSSGSGQSLFVGARNYSAGNATVYIADGGSATVPYNTTGNWTNWTVINDVNNNNAYIYSNGVLRATLGSKAAGTYSAPLYLGKQGSLDGEYFNGRMSIVRAFNRALTSAEVAQEFNAFRGRYGL